MDSIDRELTRALALNGRATFSELAEQIGLSGPSTAERVRRLEERAVIRGYHADLDPRSFSSDLTAFVWVTLTGDADRSAFLDSVAGLREVLECHHVAGEDDYAIKIRCAGTAGLERFVSAGLRSLPGVARTRTTVVLSTAFERPFIPIEPE